MTRARFTMLVLVFLAVAGIAVACGSGSSSQDEEQVQLVYQDWRTAWFSPMVEEMMEKFHETHPNIRVFFSPNPPKDTDGRREESGRGVRELQGK